MNDSGISSEQRQEIIDAIFAGQKIQAIKIYREATGQDLKNSKEFIEALTAELAEKHPDLLQKSPNSGCGTAVLALVVIAVFCLYSAPL